MDFIAKAQRIVAPLRETSDESETNRTLSPRAVQLLKDAELTKLLTPASHGGYQLSPRALMEAERVVAHGCSAASWVLMVTGAHTFCAGRLPKAGLDAVFGSDPGVLIPGVPSTGPGSARRTDGGFIVSGRWPYASGADHGGWLIGGARGRTGNDGERYPDQLMFFPRSDVAVDDTWFTLGMRGTGSKDIILDEAFVPDHLTVPARKAELGTVDDVDVALYRLPIQATLATLLLGPIVGIADRILELVIEENTTRRDAYTRDEKRLSSGMQQRVAEAGAEIDCAWGVAQRSCDLLEEAMESAPPMALAARAQVRWNAAYATELCLRATNRLFGAAGAGAAADRNPLQRLGRDINTAARHNMLNFDTASEIQGKSMLGVELSEARV